MMGEIEPAEVNRQFSANIHCEYYLRPHYGRRVFSPSRTSSDEVSPEAEAHQLDLAAGVDLRRHGVRRDSHARHERCCL